MKTLNVVLAVAGLFALMPSASVWAAEKTQGTCPCDAKGTAGVATEVVTRGGKSSPGHARARAAKAESRANKRADEEARKIAAGEKPAAAAPVVVTAPVKVSAGGAGKASSAHARARDTKAAANQAATQNAE
jgi:hypothetical protein